MSYVVPIPSFNCTGRASLKRSPFRLSSEPPATPTVRRTMPTITDENNLSGDIFFYAVRYISKDRGEQRRQRGHGDKEITETRSVGVMGWRSVGVQGLGDCTANSPKDGSATVFRLRRGLRCCIFMLNPVCFYA